MTTERMHPHSFRPYLQHTALNSTPNSNSRASTQRLANPRAQPVKSPPPSPALRNRTEVFYSSPLGAAPPPPVVPLPPPDCLSPPRPSPLHTASPAPLPSFAGADDERRRRRAATVLLGAAPLRRPHQCRCRRPVGAAGTDGLALHRDLRGVLVFRFRLGRAHRRVALWCAARRGAARGRGDLRVGGARDAGAAARRGRCGWGLAGTEAAAQSRVARSPCVRHRANPRCEARHLHSFFFFPSSVAASVLLTSLVWDKYYCSRMLSACWI